MQKYTFIHGVELDVKLTDIPFEITIGDRVKCISQADSKYFGEVCTVLGWIPHYAGASEGYIAVEFPGMAASLWPVLGFAKNFRNCQKDFGEIINN